MCGRPSIWTGCWIYSEREGCSMTYTQPYPSPLGDILLAADELGLTGAWFEGGAHFAAQLPAEHTQQETPTLAEAKRWTATFPAGSPMLCRRCIPSAPPSSCLCGSFCCKFPTARPRPTVPSPGSLPSDRGGPGCLPRPSAVRWGATKSPSSFPATGWSAQTAV